MQLDLDVDATVSLEVWLPEDAPNLSEDDSSHIASEVRASSSVFHRIESDFKSEKFTTADVFSLDGEFNIFFHIFQT